MGLTPQKRDHLLRRANTLESQVERGLGSLSELEEQSAMALRLFEAVYGRTSPQFTDFQERRSELQRLLSQDYRQQVFYCFLLGRLRSLCSELRDGLLENLVNQNTGSILGDLLALAHESLRGDSASGPRIAGVLAAAAFEGALKQGVTRLGLQMENQPAQELVNALASAGVWEESEKKRADEHVRFRNAALHASWEEINIQSTNRVIQFTEQFITKHFGS